VLTRLADARGPLGTPRAERVRSATPAAAAAPSGWLGVLSLIARHRYLVAVALVALFTNWVNTNGENIMFRVVQDALQHAITARGITDKAAVHAFVREGTTAFYGDFFFWVNAFALVGAGAARLATAAVWGIGDGAVHAAGDLARVLHRDGARPG
jgi:AAA family ATP:ADP antiporter